MRFPGSHGRLTHGRLTLPFCPFNVFGGEVSGGPGIDRWIEGLLVVDGGLVVVANVGKLGGGSDASSLVDASAVAGGVTIPPSLSAKGAEISVVDAISNDKPG